MKLRLLKFATENVRDFKDLEVSFADKAGGTNPYSVSLIQMPNGTGKTTAHILIATALTGREPLDEEVMSYKPTLFKADKGSFEVLLAIDDKQFLVRLDLDYTDGTHQYRTSRTGIAGGGMEKGHNLPIQVKKVMTEKFARLLVFDGELAKKLLDRSYTEAEIAIKSLYLLDRLDDLQSRIDETIENRRNRAEATQARTDQGLRSLRTQLANVLEYEKSLSEGIEQVKQSIKTLDAENEAKRREHKTFITKYDEINKKYEELSKAIENKTREIASQSLKLLRRIGRPSQFSPMIRASLSSLAEKMTSLKLPRTTSVEFFDELAKAVKCVCGTPLDESKRETIRANASSYLSEDITAIMNALKHAIRGMDQYEDPTPMADKIPQLRSELVGLTNERDGLSLKMDEETRNRITQLEKDMRAAEAKLKELAFDFAILTEEDTTFQKDHELNWKENLPLCKRRIEELQEKVRAAARTVLFEKQANVLKNITDCVSKEALQAMRKKIVKKANERIFKILGSQDVIIDRIEGCIILSKKKAISEGQTLAVAYAFLSTLFEDSVHKVPFVIDSPAVSLDFEVRREVSELLPKLFEQLVIFILSPEREGFLDGLEESGKVQYCTLFKNPKNPGEISIHQDRGFFMKFQSEGE